MPQQSLLPEQPAMQKLRIDVTPPRTALDHLQVVVGVAHDPESPPMPVWVGALPGLQADYLVTLVSEVCSAWAYGERVRDVQKAAAAVKKQAAHHERRHSF